MPDGTRKYGKFIQKMLDKEKIDKGRASAIRIRMNGLIEARSHLSNRIKMLKSQGKCVKVLEKSLKAYDKDIAGFKKTLGES